MLKRLPCFILIIFIAALSHAYDFSPRSNAQTAKQAQRWSLAQWMEQKGKLQWMDLWLNANSNSPSFYEIFIGADYTTFDQSLASPSGSAAVTTDGLSAKAGHMGMFISIFGVYGRYEKSAHDERVAWDALGQLRLLGASDQGSNLTVFYGLRGLKRYGDFSQNQQAGGSLTLYLLQPWAVQGRYAQFFEKAADSGTLVSGHRIEVTSWLEWGPIRLYGTWFKEPLKLSISGNSSDLTYQGYNFGIRTYLDFKK